MPSFRLGQKIGYLVPGKTGDSLRSLGKLVGEFLTLLTLKDRFLVNSDLRKSQ